MATKKAGADIPNAERIRANLSKNVSFLTAAKTPRKIPKMEATIIELKAKTAVSGNVSDIISDTLRLVI